MVRDQRNHTVPPVRAGSRRPLLYCITDGTGVTALARVQEAAASGVDYIQIREKQLAGRELLGLCRAARSAIAHTAARLLVNDRLDIALAAGLDGVHLPAAGLPITAVRGLAPPGFLIGRSCHGADEVEAAAAAGANFCVLGPIFATPSKAGSGAPLGLAALETVAQAAIPIFALGGVTWENASACLGRGAAGVAGIRLFAPRPGTAGLEFA